ncbi:hypothetical protein [Jeotgalibacillus soli]|uniref:Uncharacterized protein n=1 Tax=Jeotgalibacillus soli TaxID=889306 RepID=A0A0C2RGH2_9BACL|nr:hypothetical protein [Jeotgalibacillus soli]KIL49290.1 hypothetical protein KP78_07580 [Jeotgalibacillus soli]
MSKENKMMLNDFVNEDQFELNTYLTYLLKQTDYIPNHADEKNSKVTIPL